MQALVREMYARLLAGYAADAVERAATAVAVAARVLAGRPAGPVEDLDALINALGRGWPTDFVADARWVHQLRAATESRRGQICPDRDQDAQAAIDISLRLALVSGLITISEAAACKHGAAWQASAPPPPSLLRLDRATHRKALDDLLAEPRRVVVMLVHGEVDQGHDHFAEITTSYLQSASSGPWREVVISWPPPSPSLGTRLAMLLDALARGLGVALVLPVEDPTTPLGAQAWSLALKPIADALAASSKRLFLRHVVRWPGTGPGGDDVLVDAYLRAIWASIARQSGKRVIVGLELRRVQRGGFPLTRAWRIARAELAAAQAIERVLDRHDLAHDGLCIALPELTSVPIPDLVHWLRTHGGRGFDAALAEANRLVSCTRGGRFDLVLQRLIALHIDRHATCHGNDP